MRIRSTGLTLFAGLSIFVAACSSSGASTSPSAAATAAPPSAAPSVERIGIGQSRPRRPRPPSRTSRSASSPTSGRSTTRTTTSTRTRASRPRATAIGAAAPPAVVPKDAVRVRAAHPGVRRPEVQHHRDGRLQPDAAATGSAAKTNPDDLVHRRRPGPDLRQDATARRTSRSPARAIRRPSLPNYISIDFQEDQAGYLAGIVAASVSKSGTIGAIGGTTLCAPCVRYIQGYELGAQVGQPDDQGQDRVRHQRLLQRRVQRPGRWQDVRASRSSPPNKVDVLFQVAGKTGNGVLEAACDANIYGIGVDVDQALSYPNAAKCIVTSAEKHLQLATGDGHPGARRHGQKLAGDVLFDAKTEGIGVSPGHDLARLITPDIQTQARRGDGGDDGRHARDLPGDGLRRLPPSSVHAPSETPNGPADPRPARSSNIHPQPRGRSADDQPRSTRFAHPLSRCAASRSAIRASSPTTASTSTSGPARSTPCSARTAPARRPS